MDLLRQNVENVLTALTVALKEAEEIQAQRKALEASGYALSDREKKIYLREVDIKKRESDIESQKKYIEEQNHNTQLILNKILTEKEGLKGLVEQKREIEQSKVILEEDKKAVEGLKKEKQLFNQEKLALIEGQKLLILREASIKVREEKLDRIERMTAL